MARASRNNPKPSIQVPPGWYQTSEICRICDFGTPYFQRAIRDLIPPTDVMEGDRKTKLYRARAVIDILIERASRSTAPKADSSLSALEARIAAAKADREETAARLAALEEKKKLEEQQIRHGRLIELSDLELTLGHIADSIRKVGESFARKPSIRGEDAQEMLNRVLESLQLEADSVRGDEQ